MTLLKRPNGAGFIALGYVAKQVNGVKQFEHVRVAEAALGKPLPPGAVVHHVNEVKTDNRGANLVICPDRAYHNLIHARMDAMAASGDPNKRACRHCKQYDHIAAMRDYETKAGTHAYWHVECSRAAAKVRNFHKRNQK